MSAEQLATRRERISYIEGLIKGMALANQSKDATELDEYLEVYRKEISRINDQIDQEAVNNK